MVKKLKLDDAFLIKVLTKHGYKVPMPAGYLPKEWAIFALKLYEVEMLDQILRK
jgi:hypothetical protein